MVDRCTLEVTLIVDQLQVALSAAGRSLVSEADSAFPQISPPAVSPWFPKGIRVAPAAGRMSRSSDAGVSRYHTVQVIGLGGTWKAVRLTL
jgi:hypothetical protein